MVPNTVESGGLGDVCRLAHELCGAAPVQQDTLSGFRKEGLEVLWALVGFTCMGWLRSVGSIKL